MKPESHAFKRRAAEALRYQPLQDALAQFEDGWVAKRRTVVERLPEFEQLRAQGAAIRDEALRNLDLYLEQYESAVQRNGGQVHWARDAGEAQEIVRRICREAGARTVTRGKSMAGEEIGVTEALQADGIRVVDTDLGEYIIQLAEQRPSHIVFPCVHLTGREVAELFRRHHAGKTGERDRSTVSAIVQEAREVLREEFFAAEVGITGANFLVAETGSNFIVTNEGNGDLTCTLPRVHVVTTGIERVVPTLEDASTLLRLLGRSATGQEITAYTTLSTGPRRSDDPDGPDEYHVVLVDNGRSRMLAGEFREMLRCIRCGACMNHCPVYRSIGGHPYGWVYPGPMGAVLTPLHVGLKEAGDLPNACTMNGHCAQVCPVQIPLPSLIRKLRGRQFAAGLTPRTTVLGLRAWAFTARHPTLYHALTRWPIALLRRLGRRRGRLRRLPLAGGWISQRDFPAPAGKTFFSQWPRRGEDER